MFAQQTGGVNPATGRAVGTGDVVQRVAYNGTTSPRYDYDAFGNQRDGLETDPNPFRYCGEYFDGETGDVYLRARYYNTSTGRFTSEDPAKDGEHWYGYCGNNPVRNVDPTGLKAINPWEYKPLIKPPTKNTPFKQLPTLIRACKEKGGGILSVNGGTGSGGYGSSGGGTRGSAINDDASNHHISAGEFVNGEWTGTSLENQKSARNILTLHPDIRISAMLFLLEAQEKGINLTMTEGYRSIEDQQKVYDAGRSSATPGQSYHQYGLAFDVYELEDGKIVEKTLERLREIEAIGAKYGLNGAVIGRNFMTLHIFKKHLDILGRSFWPNISLVTS